ncbi:MAG: serine hydrolase, partial [Gemmatimonadetes bacterium]|nr:serine hydrolase [Gemmatimonadota bacterium]
MTHAISRVFVRVAAALFVALSTASAVVAQQPYFPPPGDAWERRTPEQMGFTKRSVDSAIAIALKNESTAPRDLLANHQQSFGREPMGEAIGPFRERGGAAGMIVRRGYIVAEWGDPNRVDVTYSVTKSFVTTTVGLAFDRKMIRAVTDKVGDYMAPIVVAKNGSFSNYEVLAPFESEHNRKITWEHLLRQTSDWQGTLWGKPDWVDRFPRNTTDTASVINRARF